MTTFSCTMQVQTSHLAQSVGSGDLPVLSTPMMMALMEQAAMRCVAPELPEGQTTVGGEIHATHLRPTVAGATITATATLLSHEGRRYTFQITAHDENGLIGEGTHTRFVVDRERFMKRALTPSAE